MWSGGSGESRISFRVLTEGQSRVITHLVFDAAVVCQSLLVAREQVNVNREQLRDRLAR